MNWPASHIVNRKAFQRIVQNGRLHWQKSVDQGGISKRKERGVSGQVNFTWGKGMAGIFIKQVTSLALAPVCVCACVHVCVCVCVCLSFSGVLLFVTLWTVASQAPLSMEFSRQEYWSEMPFPSSGNLPNPGMQLMSPTLQTNSLPSESPGKPYPTSSDQEISDW